MRNRKLNIRLDPRVDAMLADLVDVLELSEGKVVALALYRLSRQLARVRKGASASGMSTAHLVEAAAVESMPLVAASTSPATEDECG